MTNSTDRYLKLSASFTAVGTNATENATIEKKIQAFNEKNGKWTYVIAAASADNLTKSRADLVKPKEEPKKEDAAGAETK